jgi:hypothetical protein
MLYFHDLPPAREGEYLAADPPELRDEWHRRASYFMQDREPEGDPIELVGFIVTGPERVDRYGLALRADRFPTRADLDATRDAIKRTMPTGWHLVVRSTTV